MKSMRSAPDFIQAPLPGRYPSKISVAEAGHSKKGESHISLTLEIVDGPHKGATAYDYVGTDGTTKYGIGGKRKLRQLGISVDSDDEIPDVVIAQQLLNLHLMVEYGNEQQQTKAEGSETLTPRFELDANGNKVAVNRLIVIGYIRAQSAVAGQSAQLQAPQGYAPQAPATQNFAPQGYAPQGVAVPAGLPQSFAGYPGAPAGAPLAAPAPAGLPAAWANGQQPQMVTAPPGWAQPK